MDASRSEVVSAVQPAKSDRNILLAAKGGGIAFAGNLFVYIFRFLFGLVLARMLGAELLGLYSLSSTVTSLLSVLSVLGISAGVVRFIPIARNQKDDARLWGIILTGLALPALVSTVLVIGVILLAKPIALGIFGRPDLVPVLRLDSLGVPFVVLLSVLSSITQGFKRMEYKVISEDVTWNLLKLVLSVVLLVAGLGVMGAVLANNIAAAAAVAVSLFFLHRLFPLNRPVRAAKQNVREMLGFSLPIYLTRVLSRFSGSIEALVLGFLGLVSGVGIYTTALRLSGVGMLFHYSLQQIAMPMISDLHDRDALDELTRLYRATTKWGMTFNLPVFLTMALFAGPLLSIFGADFVEGATGLIILAFATLFNASTGVCGSVITMTGHSKMTFFNSVFNLGVNLALDLLLIPPFGIIGAALAVTLSEVTLNVIRTVQVFVLLRVWPYDWSFLKPIASSLMAVGATYLLSQRMGFMPVALQVILGTLLLWSVYAAGVVLLKLSDEDRLVLRKLQARFRFWQS